MKLCDKIYQLRTEKELSQGDLAAFLDVSRQSVSKWETGASVPDLDKLIRMKEIFGVTLEALVCGDELAAAVTEETPPTAVLKEVLPLRKVIGALCFCLSFTALLVTGGATFSAFADAAVYVFLGLVCFLMEKRVPLFCAWIVWYGAYGKLYFRKELRMADVLDAALYHSVLRSVLAWMLLFVCLFLFVVTLFSFRNAKPPRFRGFLWWLFGADLVLILSDAVSALFAFRHFEREIAVLTQGGTMAFEDYLKMLSLYDLQSAFAFGFIAVAIALLTALGVIILLIVRQKGGIS